MTGLQVIFAVIGVVAIGIAILAIWLTCVLLREDSETKKAIKDVQCAFGNIDIEIGKKLKVHNALHYSDLLNIIKYVGDLVPGVNITIDKDPDSNRVSILVDSGEVKSKYTFLGTVVEYGVPRLSETV